MRTSEPEMSQFEQRANIKFCQKLGKTAAETFQMMQHVYGEDAHSVPRILSQDQRDDRMTICGDLISSADGDPTFLNRIITGDETWCFLHDPQLKRQSATWKMPLSPRQKKPRQDRSKGKNQGSQSRLTVIVNSTELVSILRSRNMFAFFSDERAFNIESYFRTACIVKLLRLLHFYYVTLLLTNKTSESPSFTTIQKNR
ncbi:hypothetical protein ANN_04103 [Periplaneta americana]|uniref:Uncharacterized protein n=1 Tax=Periplaneta americana TaxID=6978 RepID=A0ABQ8T972_PERAM|nr:hypothetical protein ANN_04103 [Periplaneta americana]